MGLAYSNTTTRDGILQHIERYTGLGNTAISGNATLLQDFTAYVNSEMRGLWHTIFRSTGNWTYDDANQTDLPQASTGLTSATAMYALPSDALTINRIEVKDSTGEWYQIKPVTESDVQIAIDEYRDGDGLPTYYRVIGSSVELFPAPNYTQSASLKVYFDRGSVAFATDDTTQTPGFASEYHDLVPVGASLKWMKTNKPKDDSLPLLQADYDKLLNNLGEFYQRQFKDKNKRTVLRRRYQSFK